MSKGTSMEYRRADRLRTMLRGVESSNVMDPEYKKVAVYGLKMTIEALDPPECAARACNNPRRYGWKYCNQAYEELAQAKSGEPQLFLPKHVFFTNEEIVDA